MIHDTFIHVFVSLKLNARNYITNVYDFSRNFVKQVKSVPTLKYRYPMVLLDGVNHGIFSNGELPHHLLLQDITSDTVTSLLLQDIVHSISLFFIYCEDNYNTDVLSQFDTYFKETTDMLEVGENGKDYN